MKKGVVDDDDDLRRANEKRRTADLPKHFMNAFFYTSSVRPLFPLLIVNIRFFSVSDALIHSQFCWTSLSPWSLSMILLFFFVMRLGTGHRCHDFFVYAGH